MKKQHRHRGRPSKPLPLRPVHHVMINLSRPEAVAFRAAARRAQMPVATWVRTNVVPIALNATAPTPQP